ncbi:MAG TPA: ATP synthase F0 subunit C [Deltaproteobacteria bacterium]|nr:ATP synthase F0 subunit C [Deltaproteobacteria bacterium]
MEEHVLKYFTACVTAAGFGITIAAAVCGIAQSLGLKSAVEGIARNPESSGKVTVTMIIGLALIESLCIYTLVIAFMLLGKAPKLEMMIKLLGQ